MMEWIGVKDKLPELGQTVLVYIRNPYRPCEVLTYTQLSVDDKPMFRPGGYEPGRNVLYWMPLPPVPEGESNV